MAQRCLQVHALAAAATAEGAALLPPPHTPPAPDALPPLQSMCTDGDCRYSQTVGKASGGLRTSSGTRVVYFLGNREEFSTRLVDPLLQPLGYRPVGVLFSPLPQVLPNREGSAGSAKCELVTYLRCFQGALTTPHYAKYLDKGLLLLTDRWAVQLVDAVRGKFVQRGDDRRTRRRQNDAAADRPPTRRGKRQCPQAGEAPRGRSGSERSDGGGVGRGSGGAGGGHGGGSGGGSGASSSCSGGAGAGGGEAGSGGQEAAADRSRLTCTFVPPRFTHGSQGLDTPFPPSTAEVQITRPAYSLLLLLQASLLPIAHLWCTTGLLLRQGLRPVPKGHACFRTEHYMFKE